MGFYRNCKIPMKLLTLDEYLSLVFCFHQIIHEDLKIVNRCPDFWWFGGDRFFFRHEFWFHKQKNRSWQRSSRHGSIYLGQQNWSHLKFPAARRSHPQCFHHIHRLMLARQSFQLRSSLYFSNLIQSRGTPPLRLCAGVRCSESFKFHSFFLSASEWIVTTSPAICARVKRPSFA